MVLHLLNSSKILMMVACTRGRVYISRQVIQEGFCGQAQASEGLLSTELFQTF